MQHTIKEESVDLNQLEHDELVAMSLLLTKAIIDKKQEGRMLTAVAG